MRSQFLKNLFLLQGLNLIIKPFWLLVVDRTAQNILGNTYGEYYIALNLTLVFSILLDIGIQNFNNTHVASDTSFFKQNFKTLFTLKTLLSLIYFALVFTLGYFKDIQSSLLLILLFSQIFSSFILYLRSNINGLHHYKIDSFLSVSDKTFAIIFCIAFFYSNLVNIYYFAVAQLVALFINFLIALFINIKFYSQIPDSPTTNNVPRVRMLIVKSFPFAMLFALMALYTRLDVLLMNLLLDNPNFYSALYAQSYRLLDASSMFAMLFAGLLLPMYSKLITQKQDVKPLTQTAFTILSLIAIVVSMSAILFDESIMKTLYNYQDIESLKLSVKTFRMIMLSFIPISFVFIFSTLLTAQKDIKFLITAALIALLLNLALNMYLIPRIQVYGASIAALLTQSTFALLCTIRCFQLFHFKLNISKLIKYVIFIFSLVGVFVLIKGLDILWINLIIFVIMSFVLSVLLKIVNVKNFLSFFVSEKQ
ncbi:MAG: polysaccharide biosynthesis C-terminal domain-containing protein [Bacteroidota bacterium]|nr:polysaccharide biosynthesis C-terminal domain-containing protein [Bacteroidota bacterium]